MRPILIIPGHRNSGASHWQTLWEGNMAYAKRVQMPNWDFPHLGHVTLCRVKTRLTTPAIAGNNSGSE